MTPTRSQAIERAAHGLLVWTHQYALACDELPARGWWHVDDLNPSARDKMNAAEQQLYDALKG